MRILIALKHKKPLKWGIFATIIIAIVLPVIQTGFLQNSLSSWFLTLIKSPLNSLLFIIFSLLFGGLISLQVFNLERKVCDNKSGVKTGIFGVVFGSLVGICPACIGLVGLILPLGASLWLTYYGWVFMLVAIGIMIYSIYRIGGFER